MDWFFGCFPWINQLKLLETIGSICENSRGWIQAVGREHRRGSGEPYAAGMSVVYGSCENDLGLARPSRIDSIELSFAKKIR